MSGAALGVGRRVSRKPGGCQCSSASRMIRNDQDSLTQLLQLGLVVLVSVRRAEVRGAWGEGMVTPQPPLIAFLLLQGSQESQESELPNTLRNVVIGLGVALVLVIVIMTMILVCVQKRCCSRHPPCVSNLTSFTTQDIWGVEGAGV